MDYKQTLNLPLADGQPGALPQRANLPQREPEIQALWDRTDLFREGLKRDCPRGSFILHDGPPYSNGNIHLGHALNKIAKDIIVKSKAMEGYFSPYVPGWDNHGMPIENEVSKEFRSKGEKPDKVTMRKRCREFAAGFVEKQKAQFKRLGVIGDWDHPYLTMDFGVEAKIVEAFGELAEKGYIYRGLKPVMWCCACETALADAEIEYQDHTSQSITVRFPVSSDPEQVFGRGESAPENCYVLIWTTTPWTIPANLALAVAGDADYVIVERQGARYLVAEPLAAKVLASIHTEDDDFEIVRRLKGIELRTREGEGLGVVARHPLFERPSPIVLAAYVTMEDGTGIVHTAPGHGKEDFDTGVKEGLPALCPVDGAGTFTREAGEAFVGKRILNGEANAAVIDALKEAGALVSSATLNHSYPHCWRCHNPLIFRATVQWFMNIDHELGGQSHRQLALEEIEATTWYPPVSKNRIAAMVGGRPDWCLSRQRAWGVGIPAFYCKSCGAEDLSKTAIASVASHVRAEGSDVWYAKPAADLVPVGHVCAKCGEGDFEKETDILDVWFDSGSTHLAVLESGAWPDLQWPADVYLEGSDQHRGWFNSSLMIGVGTRGAAPYKSVITNGWVLDDQGKAMHKSLGNVVSPLEVIDKYGADILRLWVASTDYFEDVRCGDAILSQVAETYRRIRNTLRWLVNNLAGFDPDQHSVAFDAMHPLDQWALVQLDGVINACRTAYDTYEFHRVYHTVNNFCAVDLSAFYLDVSKDRLYCSAPASWERRSGQTALYTMASAIARLIAPILSHTADEVWQLLPGRAKALSVLLADMPSNTAKDHETIAVLWQPLMKLRDSVSLAVETARTAKRIANPLQAQVTLSVSIELGKNLEPFAEHLAAIFKVSQVRVEVRPGDEPVVTVEEAVGAKCARCWLIREEVGAIAGYDDLCARCALVVGGLTE